jgi:anti-sigma factor RsiW
MNTPCLTADQLAAYEAGEGSPETRAEVAAHLATCLHCRQELAWLTELRGRVEKLPRQLPPVRDLWDGIAPRLEVPVIALPRQARFRPMVLAAAAVFLILMASAATVLLLQRGTVAPAPGSAASLAQLASEVRALEQALPPETRALVSRNLALIDAAIRESEAALAADPANPAIGRMLEARYGQRRGLLEQARRASPRS